MELKVWVEGIQRIVCGVTEATTCQDVVYALAHATGKTGRFTLIERWRSNERLLPPQEHPLHVLSKWGEYSNDVQLVLRHARESSATSSCRATPDSVQHGVTSPQPHHNDAAAQVKATSPQPSVIKKSLTFSSGGEVTTTHTNGGINPDFVCHNNSKGAEQQQTIRDPSKERRDWSDVPRGVVKGIPQQPTRESPRWTEPPTTSSSFPNYRSSRSATEKEPGPSKMFAGQNGRICTGGTFGPASVAPTTSKHNGRCESDNASPNVKNASQDTFGMHQQCVPSPSYVPPPPPPPPPTSMQTVNHVNQCNNATGLGNLASHQSPYSNRFGGGPNPKSNLGGGGSSGSSGSPSSSTTIPALPVHLGTPKSRRNLLSEFKRHDLEEELQEDFPLDPIGKQERVIFDARYRDLVRLINLQREKLSRQQADFTQYDAEIAYWEEKQKEHKRQIETLECEIKKAEFTGRDVDEEVVQLDRLHLDNELDIGRQQEKMLSSELTLLRSKLSNCETELLQCKNKMRLVTDNITEDERWLSKEEDERKQREVAILNEIEGFQNDIQNTIRDYESKVGFQSETSDKYDQDVKRLETVIADKKKQVESLVREMKEANLESLTFTPSEEIRQLLEGGAHKGPGSSRKIVGSPRQLENAVPTSKNPHGVWV